MPLGGFCLETRCETALPRFEWGTCRDYEIRATNSGCISITWDWLSWLPRSRRRYIATAICSSHQPGLIVAITSKNHCLLMESSSLQLGRNGWSSASLMAGPSRVFVENSLKRGTSTWRT